MALVRRTQTAGSSDGSSFTASSLPKHVVAGYEAPLLWPVFFAALLSALLLNEFHHQLLPHHHYYQQQQPALPHALVVAVAGALLALHEIARPCAASFADIGALVASALAATARASAQHARRGFRPQFRGWSAAFHVFQAITNDVAMRHGHKVIWLRNAQTLRRNAHAFGRVQGWLSCLRHGTMAERFAHIGLEHLWLRASSAAPLSSASFLSAGDSPEPLVVLYLHGGGYSSMSPDVYIDFCNRLRARILREWTSQHQAPDVHVLIANYRKIPEVVYPAPADDCMAMYEYLTGNLRVPPRRIVLAGDSAGAGLVLSTLRRVRDAGGARPLAAVCCCPWVDLSGCEALATHCILQKPVSDGFREFFFQSPRAWHEAHAVARDLSALPPLLVQTGAFDVFHGHALRLARKAQADGVRGCELDVHADMPHVFPVFPAWLLPGSEAGVTRMAQFVAKHASV